MQHSQAFTRAKLRALRGRLLCQPIHLALHEPPIGAIPAHQQVGRAVLYDFAEMQHDDAVETPDRRQPMRDGDHGAPAHQPAQCFADRFLRLAVERGLSNHGYLRLLARDFRPLRLGPDLARNFLFFACPPDRAIRRAGVMSFLVATFNV